MVFKNRILKVTDYPILQQFFEEFGIPLYETIYECTTRTGLCENPNQRCEFCPLNECHNRTRHILICDCFEFVQVLFSLAKDVQVSYDKKGEEFRCVAVINEKLYTSGTQPNCLLCVVRILLQIADDYKGTEIYGIIKQGVNRIYHT